MATPYKVPNGEEAKSRWRPLSAEGGRSPSGEGAGCSHCPQSNRNNSLHRILGCVKKKPNSLGGSNSLLLSKDTGTFTNFTVFSVTMKTIL